MTLRTLGAPVYGKVPAIVVARVLRQYLAAFERVKSKRPLERFDADQQAGVVFHYLLTQEGVWMRAVGETILGAPPSVLRCAEADELIEKALLVPKRSQPALAS